MFDTTNYQLLAIPIVLPAGFKSSGSCWRLKKFGHGSRNVQVLHVNWVRHRVERCGVRGARVIHMGLKSKLNFRAKADLLG